MSPRRLFIIIAIVLLLLVLTPSSLAEKSKTDVKIITHLEGGGFLTPALSENNTFVYNNFQFHLYSNTNNTTYRIVVDNITIASSIIKHFKKVFYWQCSKSFIGLLEIYMGNDYYNYTNIFVFRDTITNRSILKEEEKYKIFTKEEFKRFVMEIELKSAGSTLIGSFACFYIMYHLVKKHKEKLTKRIL